MRLHGARSLALIFLLFSEVLYLSIRFDTEVLDGTSTWWSGFFGKPRWLCKRRWP
jgi:hypothetical protein